MKTTLEFISDLKNKTGIESDYAIAKLLGVTKNAISLYRTGKGYMGDEVAIKVADMLGLEPGYVLACIAAERSKDAKVKKVWEWSAQHLGGLAAVLAVVAFLPFAPGIEADSLSAPALLGFAAEPMYIMSNWIAAYWLPLSILTALAWHCFPRHRLPD